MRRMARDVNRHRHDRVDAICLCVATVVQSSGDGRYACRDHQAMSPAYVRGQRMRDASRDNVAGQESRSGQAFSQSQGLPAQAGKGYRPSRKTNVVADPPEITQR